MKTTSIYTLSILLTIAHSFQLNQPITISKLSNQQQLHQQSSQSRTRCNLSMRWGLKAGGSANKPTGNLPDGVALRDTVPFELRGFSLPLVVFSVGVVLTLSSFAGFFLDDGGSGGAVSSLGFVYGIPVFLIGLSLWYAEIPPAELITDAGETLT